MIDNSEVKRVAKRCIAHSNIALGTYPALAMTDEALLAFSQHFYKKGQDEQREKDAQICEGASWVDSNAHLYADAIRNASTQSKLNR